MESELKRGGPQSCVASLPGSHSLRLSNQNIDFLGPDEIGQLGIGQQLDVVPIMNNLPNLIGEAIGLGDIGEDMAFKLVLIVIAQ